MICQTLLNQQQQYQMGPSREIIPSSVDSLTTKEGPYTYEEMLLILSTQEWNKPMIV